MYFLLQRKEKNKLKDMFTVLEIHVDEHFRPDNSEANHKYRVTSHSGILLEVEVRKYVFSYTKKNDLMSFMKT